MPNATLYVYLIAPLSIALTFALAALVAFRADLTRARGGKILAFMALFLLPSVAVWRGFSEHMQRSKTTQFCLSCHVMQDYGRSLHMFNQRYLAAAHFENIRIPREQACYSCHTDYSMFGGLRDKWRGLHHVYREYLGTVPQPEKVKLYRPFNNRECLYCHARARSYLESKSHQEKPETLPLVKANKLSCMSSDCHDVVHDVADLKDKDTTFWEEPQ